MRETSDATPKCPYCGQHHIGLGMCPHVRAAEYHPDGTIKRVEFHGPAQYVPIPVCPQQPLMHVPVWYGPCITITYGSSDMSAIASVAADFLGLN